MNPEHGGPSQGIRNMVPALQEIGVYNEVVCFDDPDSSYLSSSAFTIHALGNGKGPYSYNGKLSEWLKNNFHRFDVVVIHGLW
ncbi:MAG: glycosyl transferase family 1, partial [Flavobacterium sp.]